MLPGSGFIEDRADNRGDRDAGAPVATGTRSTSPDVDDEPDTAAPPGAVAGFGGVATRLASALRPVAPLLLIAPILVVLVVGVVRRWTSNNGFVYFRTVDQFMAGNGLVYNAGERVETFMSPVWMAGLVIADLTSPLRLEATAAVLSVACVAGAMVLATIASSRIALLDAPTSVLLPLGSAVLAVLWPVWVWSTGGTEVGLSYLWVALCLFLMTRWAIGKAHARGPLPVPSTTLVIAGMGWIVRPELFASSVIFVGVLVVMSTTSKRQRWTMVAIAAAVPLIYQIFRMGYYGMIVPNPAIARDALSPHPREGWNYLVNFVGPYGIFVPVIVIAVGVAGPLVRRLVSDGLTRAAAVTLAVSGSGLVQVAVLVIIGGDHVHARLLLPALFAFLAPFSVVAVRRTVLEPLVAVALWLPICALVLRTDGVSASVLGTTYSGNLTYEDFGFSGRGGDSLPGITDAGVYRFDPYSRSVSATGVAMTDNETAILANGVGPIGYVAGPDVRIIDLTGGADPITAHQRADVDWFIGLAKVAHAPWIVAELADSPETVVPGAIVAGDSFSPDPSGLEAIAEVAWAQASLRCGQLDQLRMSYDAPLTPGRFAQNLWNALPNTELRFDEDARDAAVELCGTRQPDAVAGFDDRVSVVDELPESMAPGDIAIVRRCGQVVMADDRGDRRLLEAATFTATVIVDPGVQAVGRAVVFELGPYDDTGSNTEISVETDGLGNFRVRGDTDFFPPSLNPWQSITTEPVVITFAPDPTTQQWLVFVGLDGLVTLPMSRQDGDAAAFVPTSVASSAPITVTHSQSEASAACQSFLPHQLD